MIVAIEAAISHCASKDGGSGAAPPVSFDGLIGPELPGMKYSQALIKGRPSIIPLTSPWEMVRAFGLRPGTRVWLLNYFSFSFPWEATYTGLAS